MLAVFETGARTYRIEVGLGLSGYAAFRYSGLRLIVHHSGMTLREAADLVARWMCELAD